MNKTIRLLAFGAVLAAPVLLSAKITRTVEKTFAVQPGGNLKVSTSGGEIVVKTADIAEVRITAREEIRASSEQEADEVLKDLDLTMTQQGNDVTAEAKYEKSFGGFHIGNWPPVQVSFVVTVPTKFNANLHTSGGDISVASLTGNVRAKTSGGGLHFERIDGELDGDTSGGDIVLREGTARAELRTSGGNVEVERAGGPTRVSTSGGNIRLQAVSHLLSATTSGGDIRAVLTEPMREDAELSTSGGNVIVQVVKGSAFQIDARTSGGDVDAAGLTVTLEHGGNGKSHLVGSVNGGGPRLKLRTSGGDIRVRAE